MKSSVGILAIILFTLLIFPACGRTNAGSSDCHGEHDAEDFLADSDDNRQTDMDAGQEYDGIASIILEENLSYIHFLYDLDYMLFTLKNNFSVFRTLYSARGVDIEAIAEELRSHILSNPEICIDAFFVNLFLAFAPLNDFAHFSIIHPLAYRHTLRTPWGASRNAGARLIYPNVRDFYEVRQSPSHRINDPDAWEEMAFDPSWLYTPYIQAREVRPNVTTEILVDDSVAYLAIDSLNYWPIPHDQRGQISSLFEEIYDFEHLIIDLRRNRGGLISYFTQAVMGPLLESDLTVAGFAFFAYGEYSAQYIDRTLGLEIHRLTGINSIDNHLREIDDILAHYSLPELDHGDIADLDYGFRIQRTIRAGGYNQPRFDGQIWLLTDSEMISAATLSAWFAQDTGFATLVGEVTGGHFGGPRTFVALPNTGILFQMDLFNLTDRNGRPLEAGVVPHYFNREGMCALETVMAMIYEGSNHTDST